MRFQIAPVLFLGAIKAFSVAFSLYEFEVDDFVLWINAELNPNNMV